MEKINIKVKFHRNTIKRKNLNKKKKKKEIKFFLLKMQNNFFLNIKEWKKKSLN